MTSYAYRILGQTFSAKMATSKGSNFTYGSKQLLKKKLL